MKVPTLTFDSYSRNDEWHKSSDAFKVEVSKYLDTILPSNWTSYIELGWQDRGYQRRNIFVVVTRGSRKRRCFRKIAKGEDFTLTAKHIAAITSYIETAESAIAAREKRDSDLDALQQLVLPILEQYKNKTTNFKIDLYSGIKISVIPPSNSSWDDVVVRIHRNSRITEATIPAINSRSETNISELETHIATYRPYVDQITQLAEQIRSQLPAEFFTKKEQNND